MGAKARTRRDWVWVGRDEGLEPFYHLCPTRQKPLRARSPVFLENVYQWESESGMDICAQWFHRITGITLRPGELRKVRFTAEVIE